MYCYRCGQYALDVEQPFWKYIRQYFENMYQFDTKLWVTLRFLFTRPGFLTAEFNAGKINSYVHPFRLYMCVSVIFFAVFLMLADHEMTKIQALSGSDLRKDVVKRLQEATSLPDTVVYAYHAPNLVQALSLRHGISQADSLIHYQLVSGRYGLARTRMPRLLFDSCFFRTELAETDWEHIRFYREYPEASIENWIDGQDYSAENWAAIRAFRIDTLHLHDKEGKDSIALRPETVYDWNRGLGDEVRMLSNEQFKQSVIGSFSKWTPLFLMALLPFFAWMLAVFYRRKRFPYMWHFAHAIHLNTIFLMLLSIPLSVTFYFGIDELLLTNVTLNSYQIGFLKGTLFAFPLALFLYLLLSFRQVYRQGWIKTFIKTVLFFLTFSAIALLLAFAFFVYLLYVESEQTDIFAYNI